MLQALKDAEKSECWKPEQRLGSEQDEEQVQIVLKGGSVDVREDVTRDHRECEEDAGSNYPRAREDRQRGAHGFSDALALTTPVGVRDETRDA